MEQLSFWEDSSILNHLKSDSNGQVSSRSATPTPLVKEEQSLYRYCESVTGNLNFSTVATSEDDEYSYHKKKMSRDPMSHRIIEKRRRDRMNNCLADLSRLIPADYMKKGRGRIEKTEIIEMAIKHMKHLQDHHASCHLGNCDIDHNQSVESEESYSPPESNTSNLTKSTAVLPTHENMRLLEVNTSNGSPQIIEEHYRLGYHECLSETMHFLVEVEGMYAGDKLCVQLISHLQRHCDKILKGGGLNAPRVQTETTSSSSMGSGSKERSSGSGSSSDGGERPHGGAEDNYYSSESQLRDILTSNAHSQNRFKMVPELPSPSYSLNGCPSQTETHSSTGSLYKFKNNIKQRFSAEHSECVEQSHPLALKRRRSDDHRRPCETPSAPSPPTVKYHQPPSLSPPPATFPGVPIFALHSKGSFYIPLTIDHHILAPFLADLTNMDTNLSSTVLHPVTISVNFQQTLSRPLKQPMRISYPLLKLPKQPSPPQVDLLCSREKLTLSW